MRVKDASEEGRRYCGSKEAFAGYEEGRLEEDIWDMGVLL